MKNLLVAIVMAMLVLVTQQVHAAECQSEIDAVTTASENLTAAFEEANTCVGGIADDGERLKASSLLLQAADSVKKASSSAYASSLKLLKVAKISSKSVELEKVTEMEIAKLKAKIAPLCTAQIAGSLGNSKVLEVCQEIIYGGEKKTLDMITSVLTGTVGKPTVKIYDAKGVIKSETSGFAVKDGSGNGAVSPYGDLSVTRKYNKDGSLLLDLNYRAPKRADNEMPFQTAAGRNGLKLRLLGEKAVAAKTKIWAGSLLGGIGAGALIGGVTFGIKYPETDNYESGWLKGVGIGAAAGLGFGLILGGILHATDKDIKAHDQAMIDAMSGRIRF